MRSFGKKILEMVRRGAALLCGAAVMLAETGSLSASAYNFTPVKGKEGDNYVKLDLYSDSAFMMNMDSGDVVIEVKADKQRTPASLTKIMTAVVLLDEFGGDKAAMESVKYTYTDEAYADLEGISYSYAGIKVGESVNSYDLLVALMLPSACEAANIIAIGMCGSIDAFCEKMNAKAAELGMNDSHFSNAHGLYTDNNYTTCRDLAKLCMYAIDKYPLFREVVSMRYAELSPTEEHPAENGVWYVLNTNYMIDNNNMNYYYEPCLGIKTGTLDEAGRCFASYAVDNGNRYLTVTMGAPMTKQQSDYEKAEINPLFAEEEVYYNFVDHINLYRWAFAYLSERDIVNADSEIREAKVEYGDKGRDYVTLKPERELREVFPTYVNDEEIVTEVEVYDNIIAPVVKGDVLGRMTVTYAGEQIAEIPLVATESVKRSQSESVKKVAKSFLTSKPYRIVLAVCVFGVLGYIVITIILVQNKYMKK